MGDVPMPHSLLPSVNSLAAVAGGFPRSCVLRMHPSRGAETQPVLGAGPSHKAAVP